MSATSMGYNSLVTSKNLNDLLTQQSILDYIQTCVKLVLMVDCNRNGIFWEQPR